MRTIDWPSDWSQSYVLILPEGINVQDDHQSYGKHSELMDPERARATAEAHRKMAEALDLAADYVTGKITTIPPA